MAMKKIPYVFLSFALLLVLSWSPMGVGWAADAVDNTLYAELLGKYVKGGMVDYRGMKEEEDKLDRFLAVLEKTDSSSLDREEQLPFTSTPTMPGPSSLSSPVTPGSNPSRSWGVFLKAHGRRRLRGLMER